MSYSINTSYESKAIVIEVLKGQAFNELVYACIKEEDIESLELMRYKGRFKLTGSISDYLPNLDKPLISKDALGHLDALAAIINKCCAYNHEAHVDDMESRIVDGRVRRWFVSVAKEAIVELDAMRGSRVMAGFDAQTDSVDDRQIFGSYQVLSAISLVLGERELLDVLSKRINFSDTAYRNFLSAKALGSHYDEDEVHLSVYGLHFNRPETLEYFDRDVFSSPLEKHGFSSAAKLVIHLLKEEEPLDEKFFDLFERKTRDLEEGYSLAESIDQEWRCATSKSRPSLVNYLLEQEDSIIDLNPTAWLAAGILSDLVGFGKYLGTANLTIPTESTSFPSSKDHPLSALLQWGIYHVDIDVDSWCETMLKRMGDDMGRDRLIRMKTFIGENLIEAVTQYGYAKSLATLLNWCPPGELTEPAVFQKLREVALQNNQHQCLEVLRAREARNAASEAMKDIAVMRSVQTNPSPGSP